MYLRNNLEFYENMADSKANVPMISKMFKLKEFLNDMFPVKTPNIGLRVDRCCNNIYINESFYSIMNHIDADP